MFTKNLAKNWQITSSCKFYNESRVLPLAEERVRIGVSEGGHSIEPDVIERRYWKGIKNLFEIYLPIVDGALIFDNSNGEHILFALKTIDGGLRIIESAMFNKLKDYHDNR